MESDRLCLQEKGESLHENAMALSASILLATILTQLCRTGRFTRRDSVEVVEEAILTLKSCQASTSKGTQKTYADAIELLELMIERLGRPSPS